MAGCEQQPEKIILNFKSGNSNEWALQAPTHYYCLTVIWNPCIVFHL